MNNESTLPGFLRLQSDGLLLSVKLQPRASANEIAEPLGNELRIKVTAPPVDAAANEALLRLLAETLDCPRGRVELVRGHTSRHKVVKLHGLSPEIARAKLAPGQPVRIFATPRPPFVRKRLPTPQPLGLLRAVQSLITCMESAGHWAPWLFLGLFLAASFLMIWRLESMAQGGLEGTVLGTLVMPYCSGIGNLIFAFVLGRKGGAATEVLTNCLVNNVTNMTFVLGVPAIIWGMNIMAAKKNGGGKAGKSKKGGRVHEINRLSLLLTLTAVLFFTGATWALGSDGKIDFFDGLVLVGVFLFWQCFHVFDVLKSNAQQNKSFSWMLPVDLVLLGAGAYAIYISTDWLVNWISNIHTGFISAKYIGWLSGWLMVLPNALLAVYYGWTKRPEIVYTSQVGDSHICIPLCIGIFALFKPIQTPAFFVTGMLILLGATLVHFLFIAVLGRLPRFMGWVLSAAYGYFLYQGLLK